MKDSAQSQAYGKNSTGSINIVLNQVFSIITVCFWKMGQFWFTSSISSG